MLCNAFEDKACRSNGQLQPSWLADLRKGVVQELPTCPPLLCASHHWLTWAVSNELARPLSGLCCPKTTKARLERVIRGQRPTPRELRVRVRALAWLPPTVVGTAGSCICGSVDSSGSRLTAESRTASPCMNVDAGFHSPTSSPTAAAPPKTALSHTQPPTSAHPDVQLCPHIQSSSPTNLQQLEALNT